MANKLLFELVSPGALLVSEEVDMVVVPGFDGDIGVLSGHTPMLSNLRPGAVDIHNGGVVVKRLFVEEGFAEITDNRCTLLAASARDIAEISAEEASVRQTAALERVASADDDHKDSAIREATIAEALTYALKKGSEGTSA